MAFALKIEKLWIFSTIKTYWVGCRVIGVDISVVLVVFDVAVSAKAAVYEIKALDELEDWLISKCNIPCIDVLSVFSVAMNRYMGCETRAPRDRERKCNFLVVDLSKLVG
jgi:hypothetical protein